VSAALGSPEGISVGLLRRYLRAHDWVTRKDVVQVPAIPDHLSQLAAVFLRGREGGIRDFDLYVLPTEGLPDVEIALPNERARGELVQRIDSAVTTLAAIEKRPTEEIIEDIRAIGVDRIYSRVPNALVVDDAIHLEIAANYIRDMRSLLAASANTEISPSPFYSRRVKKASQYAASCRFGHTFRGSFGFTIESPLQLNDSPTFPVVPEHAPFERRVVERFAHGVQAIVKAAEISDPTPITDAVTIGFNANACESFARLVENTSPGGMYLSVVLSSEWRTSKGLERSPEFEVGMKHVEVTRAAAKVLRERPIKREETIIGLVVDLHSRHDPLGLFGGSRADQSITIAWRPSGLAEIQVTVPLTRADYDKAMDAHRDGLPVKMSGMLEQRGPRKWFLTNVTSFEIEEAPT